MKHHDAPFMGAPAPTKIECGTTRNDYFQEYRNETIARMKVPPLRACQLHRDQYRDYSGALHALDYFKTADYMYQCPSDPTSKYLKVPEYYVKYKQPTVLPVTLERTLRTPSLPSRALTGVFSPSSDISYKR
ncbi:hypothetical protein NQ318_022758 [Aromia moschata]|uniref:Uncharacterized protein n=1 Tax=Aromia moschata TaxID=1265417 RepID=A0AAV8YF91_9CUCU|nr:hypothetical protein NQ318_022758 [Aromia moschata]